MRKEDWVEVTIDQLITKNGVFCDGDWVESKDQDPNGDIRLIQLADIGDGYFNNKSNRFLTSQKAKELKCTFLKEGDLLLARMPEPLGRAAIFPLKGDDKFVTVVDVAIIRPENKSTVNKYLLFAINSPLIRGEINALESGTTRKRISRKNLSKILFPLPPLPIQRAIVAKIEHLFASLDQGIADLKKAQAQLKVYRQAVLKKAFEGGFTYKNVKEGELPEGWKWVKLGEVIEQPKYGTSKKCSYENNDVGVLRIPNISSGYIDDEDLKFASFTNEELLAYSLKEGDLLTIRSNGSVDLVGKCALISNKDTQYLYAGYLIRLRPYKNIVNSKYLLNCMTSINLRIQIESFAKSTSGVNNINSGELCNLLISLPPTLAEQQTIVREIESRLSVCDQVEQTLQEALEKSEALRQSILKKAFEGTLLSTAEIEKCRQEGDYEPASVLLERIRKEKTNGK